MRMGLVGHPFYWGATRFWVEKEQRALIYAGGESPDGQVNMKILWIARKIEGDGTMLVDGQRIDGNGSFQQSFPGASQFSSIIDVPLPGCWRLTLTSGRLRARATFLAVSATGQG